MEASDVCIESGLKNIPEAVLKDMILEVVTYLQHDGLFIDLNLLREKAEIGTEKQWSEGRVKLIVNEIMDILRSTSKLNLTIEEVKKYLRKKHNFPEDIISIVLNFKEQMDSKLLNFSEAINMGQVVDMKWKVGVSLSSTDCKTLNLPFVTVTLTLSLSEGKKCDKTFDMTINEFQNFHEQLLEMASVLATI